MITTEQSQESDLLRCGEWLLRGETEERIVWEARMSISRSGTGYRVRFRWKKNGEDVGIERAICTVDAHAGAVRIRGVEVVGDIVTAEYEAQLSADGTTMTDGRWLAACGVGARWSADYLGT